MSRRIPARKLEKDFDFFINKLLRATQSLARHYYQVPVAGLEESVYRERVYCYELYHQLQNCLPLKFPYVLAGEVNKAGHPIFHETVGPYKPDFIVHEPRKTSGNLAVVEVKPTITTDTEFREDLRHLRLFLDRVDYFAVVSLVYGEVDDERIRRFVAELDEIFADLRNKRAILLLHKKPGEPARLIFTKP